MDVKAALTYVPLGSIVGTLLAIFYVNGYFSFAGSYWLTSLSLGDYISICIPALPAIVFGLLAGGALLNSRQTNEEQSQKWKAALDELPADQKPMRLYFRQRTWWKEMAAFALVIFLSFGYNAYRQTLYPNEAWQSPLMAIGLTVVLLFIFQLFSLWRDMRLGTIALAAFGLFALAFGFGQDAGARPFTRNPDTRLELSDGSSRCVAVLALTRQGPLIVVDRRTPTLLTWDDVRSISRELPCPERETTTDA